MQAEIAAKKPFPEAVAMRARLRTLACHLGGRSREGSHRVGRQSPCAQLPQTDPTTVQKYQLFSVCLNSPAAPVHLQTKKNKSVSQGKTPTPARNNSNKHSPSARLASFTAFAMVTRSRATVVESTWRARDMASRWHYKKRRNSETKQFENQLLAPNSAVEKGI
jgi:hypothetical protein